MTPNACITIPIHIVRLFISLTQPDCFFFFDVVSEMVGINTSKKKKWSNYIGEINPFNQLLKRKKGLACMISMIVN